MLIKFLLGQVSFEEVYEWFNRQIQSRVEEALKHDINS